MAGAFLFPKQSIFQHSKWLKVNFSFVTNQNWQTVLPRYVFLFCFIPVSLCMCFFLALAPTTPANNHTGGKRGFHFPSGGNKRRHGAGGSREHDSARQKNHSSPRWVAVSWQLASVGILVYALILPSVSVLPVEINLYLCQLAWKEIHVCYDHANIALILLLWN